MATSKTPYIDLETRTGKVTTTRSDEIPDELDVILSVPIRYSAESNDKEMNHLYLFEMQHRLLLAAAKYLSWPKSTVDKYQSSMGRRYLYHQTCTQIFENTPYSELKDVLKVNLMLTSDGKISVLTGGIGKSGLNDLVNLSEFPVPDGNIWFDDPAQAYKRGYLPVFPDTSETPISVHTRFPTDKQEHVYSAVERLRIAIPWWDTSRSQILLVNKYSEVMDANLSTTFYLFDAHEKEWFTPSLTSGGKNSATRQYALQRNACKAKTIFVHELQKRTVCWLSDGVRGFYKGYLFPLVPHAISTASPSHRTSRTNTIATSPEGSRDSKDTIRVLSPVESNTGVTRSEADVRKRPQSTQADQVFPVQKRVKSQLKGTEDLGDFHPEGSQEL